MDITRARDVNQRLTRAFFLHEGIIEGDWPEVSDITADEARSCGEAVRRAEDEEAKAAGGRRSVSMVIEAHRAPLYLAYAIAGRVDADTRRLRARASAESCGNG